MLNHPCEKGPGVCVLLLKQRYNEMAARLIGRLPPCLSSRRVRSVICRRAAFHLLIKSC